MHIMPPGTPRFNSCFLIVCLILLESCMEFGRLDYTRPSNLEAGNFTAWYNVKYPEIFPISLQVSVAPNADSTTYLFCPFPCPFPVIPWIPGIASSWFYSSDYEPEQRLWIEFCLIPNNGQVSFDPHKVTVQTSDEKKFVPAGLEGPAILEEQKANQPSDIPHLSHACSLPLHLGSTGIFGHVPDHEIITAKPICIRLGFRVSVTPATSYLLRIEGLSIDGKPVSVSPTQFQRVSRKQIWRIL